MAVYRIGDILRMKREALGITREKLCELSEGVCSPQTLYRIECGKVKAKQEVYRTLMKCMGELPERNYASIIVSKYQALNLKSEIKGHLFRKEYDKAKKKLEKIEQLMDTGYLRNKQYLEENKSKISYYEQQISMEDYLENLWEVLRCTIPSLDIIELNQWPYNCVEFDVIITIANVYHRMDQKKKEEELLQKIKENIEKKYFEEDYYVSRHTQCLVGLSQIMSMENQHEEAIEYCMKGIEESKEQKILGTVFDLLFDLAWNKEKLIQKERLDKKERESCKRLLVQAYYLSIAQKVEHKSERIKRLYECNYPDEITLL